MSRTKKLGGFDLASRYPTETIVIPLTDPNVLTEQDDTGLREEIASLYSPEARDAIRAKPGLALVDGEVQAAPATMDETFLEQTIAVTKRWWDEHGPSDGWLIDGDVVPCTPETVRRIYTDPRTAWVQKQVQRRYLDVAGFFGVSKTA